MLLLLICNLQLFIDSPENLQRQLRYVPLNQIINEDISVKILPFMADSLNIGRMNHTVESLKYCS